MRLGTDMPDNPRDVVGILYCLIPTHREIFNNEKWCKIVKNNEESRKFGK
jgi:hypothetical protein